MSGILVGERAFVKNAIRRTACVSTAVAWLLMPVRTAGAEICVDPAGNGCQLTIQAGVDVATAGQTVTVAAATYSETVEIPPGKDDLVIDASGALLDNPTLKDGISILSNGVTIQGLAFRNGKTGIRVGDGHLIRPSRTVLAGLSFHAVGQVYESCVALQGGEDHVITDSSFVSCGLSGILGESDGTLVTRNRFRACGGGCVSIYGDNAVVSGNRVVHSNGAISVTGDDARIEKNSIRTSTRGIGVRGAHPTVFGNRVSVYSGQDAFLITCNEDCAGALVSSNKAFRGLDDQAGFRLWADESGMVVSDNLTRRSSRDGFDIGGVGMIVTANKSSESGGNHGQYGFRIGGSGHVISGNTATGNANDGFHVEGAGHQITSNVASGNFGDGFEYRDNGYSPPVVVLASNVASGNLGEGFAVAHSSTNPLDVTLTENTSVGNRVAFCHDTVTGAPVDGGGNSFPLAGAPACEVDHD